VSGVTGQPHNERVLVFQEGVIANGADVRGFEA
jgi:hypothetical protein